MEAESHATLGLDQGRIVAQMGVRPALFEMVGGFIEGRAMAPAIAQMVLR